jgi:uncharacterized ion transporter superfamily protein YfcC
MHRREGSVVRVVIFISVAICFVYGVYLYHDVQTRLKKSDEKSERLRQQHDSVSAQLQGTMAGLSCGVGWWLVLFWFAI